MKVGDLVKNVDDPAQGIGIVMEVEIDMWGQQHEPPGVKVLWARPVWFDDDGGSIMYHDELEVISESR
tara:strand:+ start:362 stop:565 length:204 start_codon:yes stop_codon:yes gene_type:complete